MDEAIPRDAPLNEPIDLLPRLAANAAPAAICCFFDFAGMWAVNRMLQRRGMGHLPGKNVMRERKRITHYASPFPLFEDLKTLQRAAQPGVEAGHAVAAAKVSVHGDFFLEVIKIDFPIGE